MLSPSVSNCLDVPSPFFPLLIADELSKPCVSLTTDLRLSNNIAIFIIATKSYVIYVDTFVCVKCSVKICKEKPYYSWNMIKNHMLLLKMSKSQWNMITFYGISQWILVKFLVENKPVFQIFQSNVFYHLIFNFREIMLRSGKKTKI